LAHRDRPETPRPRTLLHEGDSSHVHVEPALDPEITVATPTVPLETTKGHSPPPEEESASSRKTPLLPASFPPLVESRATLTVLTGLHAGHLVPIDGSPVTIGRAPDSDLVIDDAGLSRHHVRIARAPDGAFYAEDLGSRNGTYLRKDRIGIALLQGRDVLQLGPHLQVRFAVLDSVEEKLHRGLYESSIHDPLTNAFNRKYLADRLLAETALAQRASGELIVLMIDIDCLKDVNDKFGHLAGDRALSAIAARIQTVLRGGDVLARYGGDEFVVVAVGIPHAEAWQFAERIRSAIEGLHLSARGREVRITASIGAASLAELQPSDDPAAALLALADARMYDAKATGRNRVRVADGNAG
jgi:diguanylate cyclase (GGDEF)-like protein